MRDGRARYKPGGSDCVAPCPWSHLASEALSVRITVTTSLYSFTECDASVYLYSVPRHHVLHIVHSEPVQCTALPHTRSAELASRVLRRWRRTTARARARTPRVCMCAFLFYSSSESEPSDSYYSYGSSPSHHLNLPDSDYIDRSHVHAWSRGTWRP